MSLIGQIVAAYAGAMAALLTPFVVAAAKEWWRDRASNDGAFDREADRTLSSIFEPGPPTPAEQQLLDRIKQAGPRPPLGVVPDDLVLVPLINLGTPLRRHKGAPDA